MRNPHISVPHLGCRQILGLNEGAALHQRLAHIEGASFHRTLSRIQALVCVPALALTLVTLSGGNSPVEASDPARHESPAIEAVLDSLRQQDEKAARWDQLFEPAGWESADTSLWIPDADLSAAQSPPWTRTRFSLRPAAGFNKVDGVQFGLKASGQWLKRPGLRFDGVMQRSAQRGRYLGNGTLSWQSSAKRSAPYSWASRTRVSGGSKEAYTSTFTNDRPPAHSWGVFVGYGERSVPFGSHRPVGSFARGLVLNLDGQNYLDRTESLAGFRWRPTTRTRTEWTYSDRRDRSIGSSIDRWLSTAPELWENARSERVHLRGTQLLFEMLRDRGQLETRDGVWIKASAWGGAFGGDREFYTLGAELRRSYPVLKTGTVELEAWGVTTGGDVPTQYLADLGGSNSLRGYAPRAVVGANSLLLRGDYALGIDPLAMSNVPLLRDLHLQPTLFVDVGAAWGTPVTSASKLELPKSSAWKSDVGFGIERLVNYPGLLHRVRLDFAWRLDRSNDRFRASFRITR